MAKHRITERFIKSVEPPDTGYSLIWDDIVNGYGIRIVPTGKISYLIFYRNKNGKQRRYAFGRYPNISPTEARKIATQILGKVASGEDPFGDQLALRGEPTFKDLAEEYINRHCSQKKSGHEDERIIKADLLKSWGDVPAKEIRRRDVIQLVDNIKDRGSPIMANRTLSVIKRMYNFGIQRDLVESNPTNLIKPPGRENKRERVLKDSEIKRFWKSVDKIEMAGPHVRSALRLILVTAQRSGEILSMEWDEVDFNSCLWELPGAKTKNGLPHRIPLSPLALDILNGLDHHGRFVFPSRIGTSFNFEASMKSGALSLAVRRNRDAFGLEVFTPHDLRRTAASHMASIGVDRFIIRRILNHAERDVTAIYDRYGYEKEKRFALNQWSAKLEEIISGQRSKIISIDR